MGPAAASARPELPRELFWKGFSDPLSGQSFEAPLLRVSAISPLSRDPDLCTRYRGVNPLHYGVIVAPSGFAGEELVYARPPKLLIRDREALLRGIARQSPASGGPAEAGQALYFLLSRERSPELVSASYELALACAAALRIPRSELAGLQLRATWVLRERLSGAEAGSEALGRRYAQLRSAALASYRECYEGEDLSRMKLGYSGVAYLIGELLRERGDYDEAFRWLSKVIQDRGAVPEIQRLARGRLELSQEQRRGGIAAEIPPLPEEAEEEAGAPAAPRTPAGPPPLQSIASRPIELILTPKALGSPGGELPCAADAEMLPTTESSRAFTVSFSTAPRMQQELVSLRPGQLEWLEAWARQRGLDASAALRAFIGAVQSRGFAPDNLSESELAALLAGTLPGSARTL